MATTPTPTRKRSRAVIDLTASVGAEAAPPPAKRARRAAPPPLPAARPPPPPGADKPRVGHAYVPYGYTMTADSTVQGVFRHWCSDPVRLAAVRDAVRALAAGGPGLDADDDEGESLGSADSAESADSGDDNDSEEEEDDDDDDDDSEEEDDEEEEEEEEDSSKELDSGEEPERGLCVFNLLGALAYDDETAVREDPRAARLLAQLPPLATGCTERWDDAPDSTDAPLDGLSLYFLDARLL